MHPINVVNMSSRQVEIYPVRCFFHRISFLLWPSRLCYFSFVNVPVASLSLSDRYLDMSRINCVTEKESALCTTLHVSPTMLRMITRYQVQCFTSVSFR